MVVVEPVRGTPKVQDDLVSLPHIGNHLLGTVPLPVRRTLHRRLLSAPWAAEVSKKWWTCSAHPCHCALKITFQNVTIPNTSAIRMRDVEQVN